ncbi:hypothetical protein ACG33_01075 [Steroidobacter denitrificans]|uniref:YkoP-like domain-containing protein n=1 Tax=Steroidobacter denitrificans TaxID=465721 RepID=A0A127F842_STEDE|nr:hypothetical protein [Steroidobacter denitrificans]AMN45719.1 hypothetical protein ACG33_01075 [Steroidobacter denitrificans]
MKWMRWISRKALSLVDTGYLRWRRLRPLGPALYLECTRYRGPELRFEDGTLLRDKDALGRLHFNNANIAALGEGSMHRVGLRFAKLMRESLRHLAEAASSDPQLQDVRVFQGVTGMPAHGEVVGFVSTPLPRTWRSRLLAGHFRLLIWVFAPAARIRARARTEPRLYWLTRSALMRNLHKFETPKHHERQRSRRVSCGRGLEAAAGRHLE